MTSDRYTRCPHCKATFKVTESQLSVAKGRVRCGACMNIFDAIAYSISPGATTKPDTAESDSPSTSKPERTADTGPEARTESTDTFDQNAPVDLEKELEQTTPDATGDDDLIQDDPEEDSEDAHYSGSTLSDELSTSFLELDQETDGRRDPYITDIREPEEDEHKDSDESWTREILDDLSNEEQQRNATSEPARTESEPLFEQNPAPTQSKPADEKEPLRFYYDETPANGKRSGLIKFLLYVVAILLLIGLLVQASWIHYEKLVQYPQIANLYARACDMIGCQLPELEDISQIKSRDLIVRSHPTAKDALIIDVVITNQANFAQPFPGIALYFSDINKKTVAQRLIKPEEYLSEEILNWGKMPSEQPIHISLELVDPGKEAVNYKLQFFPADTR